MPDPEFLLGEFVWFRFVVTNTGDVTLTDITLEDTDLDVRSCTLSDPLLPGNSFTCEIGPFEAIASQHTNTATATGDYDSETYSDKDDANYIGIEDEPNPAMPSLEFDPEEWEAGSALMEYTASGQLYNTGEEEKDVAEDVNFWYEVEQGAGYVKSATFVGDFTVLTAGECRDLDVVVTITDGWDDTEFGTEVKIRLYAEPTNRPGHTTSVMLTITSHWGTAPSAEAKVTRMTQDTEVSPALTPAQRAAQTAAAGATLTTTMAAAWLLAPLTTEGNVAVLCNDAGEHFSAPCKDLDLDHSQRERG